jgi:EF-hand domain-containing protein 1
LQASRFFQTNKNKLNFSLQKKNNHMSSKFDVEIPNQPGWRNNSPKKRPGAKSWGVVTNFGRFVQPDGSEVSIELRAEDRDMSLRRPVQDYEDRFDTTATLFNSTGLTPKKSGFTPKFARYEKMVLRWYGFYREAVDESQVEQERIRKVQLLYYLEDDTIELTEPRETNSGLPQGNLIKRHAIVLETPDGKTQESKTGNPRTIKWADIHVGNTLFIYGKTILITDADPFTRGYVVDNGGVEQQPQRALPTGVKTTWQEFIPEWLKEKVMDKDFKRYCEALLGKSWHDSEKMARFIDYNGETLKIAAYWDDTKRDFGEIADLTIIYFLEDDTLQIIEVEKPNSGKGPFNKLWARAKVLRDWGKEYFGQRSDQDTRDYLTFRDLQIGNTISVFGRPVVIAAVDRLTRIWFEENTDRAGFVQPVDNYRRDPPVVWPVREPPAWDGLGGEEDTLNSCKRLVPRRPRRDEAKYHKYEGQLLRFSSHMESDVNENNERHFVIIYYLENDTMRVFEPPIANAGFAGGKFLLRNQYRSNGKTANEPYIKAADIVVGRTLKINHFKFVVTAMDQPTRDYLMSVGQFQDHVAPGCNYK